jgi:hypothetical protein
MEKRFFANGITDGLKYILYSYAKNYFKSPLKNKDCSIISLFSQLATDL